MRRDREIVAMLARAIAEIAAGEYKQATRSAKDATEMLEGTCANCGRPWRYEGDD